MTTCLPDHIASCPYCGRRETSLYIGADRWGFCHADRVKWLLSRQLPWTRNAGDKEKWLMNVKLLWGYQIVEPACPRPFHLLPARWWSRLVALRYRFRRKGNRTDETDLVGLLPPHLVWLPPVAKWDLWHVVDRLIDDVPEPIDCHEEPDWPADLYAAAFRIREWLVQRVGR